MKKYLCFAILTMAAQAVVAAPLTLNFSSVVGPGISFSGGNFTFPNGGGGTAIQIDSVINGAGDAVGVQGQITGTYAIGAISNPFPGLEIATVSTVGPAGQLLLEGGLFSADLQWINVFTNGASGGINSGGTVNLTNMTYTGTKADLIALASVPSGTITSTFQFIPAMSLTTLKSVAATTAVTTSFSGSITPVPEPLYSGLALTGALLGALTLARRRIGSSNQA